MSFLVKAVSSVVKFLGHVSGGILGGVIGLFVGHKKSSTTKPVQRFNKTINPEEPRKIVFGKTASALDLRFWEVWGTSGANYDEVIALASHRINSVKEFYLENELAINATGTVQTVYSGVLTRAYNLGAYGQTALSVGSGSQWTSASKFDGVAHAVYKWVPNDKQLPSGIPNRYTQVIEGAPVYDPRRDSTQSGGSGAHRITDRTTWDYAALDANSVPIGRNNALQVLWYLLGWYVPNAQTSELVLTCGRGIDPTDINIASFITAANNCEAAGYYTDGILSTGDPHTDNEDKLTGSGLIGTLIDPGGLWSYYANVDDTASIDAYLTDDDITDNAGTSWNDFKPMSEQFVQVVGKFNDPGTNALYQARAYPMVRDTTYEAALGVKRRKTIDFDFIQDSLLAQKLARLALNTGQYQGELTASVNYRVMKAQLWSVVSYTSDRFGWTKLFRIRGFTISPQDGVQIALREINASIWSAGSVTTPAAISAGTKYDPRQEVAVAGLAGAAYTSAASDGTTLDGMLLSWTAAPANVLRTEIQYRQNGLTSWETLPPINGDTSSVAVANLLSGTVYNVRARHITNFEVESAWVNLSPDFTVGNSRRVLWTTVSGTTGAPSDNATVGATWGTNVGSRPAELTDGRIVAALDSAGDLARNITTARSNSSALLRYTGGGLFSGELTADTTSTHTASAITGQAATATSSDFAVLTGATKPEANATSGDNLVFNSNLAYDSAGWALNAGASRAAGAVGDPASFILTATGSGSFQATQSAKIPVPASGQLFISGSIKVSNSVASGNNYTFIQVLFYDTAGTQIADQRMYPTGWTDNVWRAETFKYNGLSYMAAPVGAATFSFSVVGYRNDLAYPAGYINMAAFRISGTQIGSDVTQLDPKVISIEPGSTASDNLVRNGAMRINDPLSYSDQYNFAVLAGVANDPALFKYRLYGGNPFGATATSGTGNTRFKLGTTSSPAKDSDYIAVSPGEKLYLSFMLKALGMQSRASIVFLDKAFTYLSEVYSPYYPQDNVWGLKSLEGTAPSNCAFAYVSCAQLNYGVLGNDSEWTQFRVSKTQNSATLGARSGVNLQNNAGTAYLGDFDIVTSAGTAAAITGQAATATSSDFAVLTGATKPANNATVGGTWGVDIGARPAELTDGRVAVALDSAGDLARNITTARANSSAILRYSGGGLFSGELTADQTSTHTASAFTGQGALATLGTVTYGTGTVTGFGAMAARAKVSLGDGFVFKNDGTTSLTDALAVTSLGVAASITGQGTGATASNLSGLNATEGTKLSGIQSLADVTAAAQVTVEMNTNLDVAADSLGAINADNLAALLWSAYVYKGGTSIKGDNNTSYALADIYGKTSGTGFAVDNTNGSSTKGIITVASGTVLAQTSGGNLVVTVAGVVQPKIPFKATRLDAPPTPPAPTGGVKSVTWVSGEFVGINSASYVTVLASLKSVVIATGESLYGTATLDYLIGGDTSASARTMSYKFQYSVTGANSWNDFPTGTTPATGTSASNSGGRGAPEYEPVSHDPGSVTISQSKATPGANTYDLRLVAITNTTGRTMTTSGTAKVEAKV